MTRLLISIIRDGANCFGQGLLAVSGFCKVLACTEIRIVIITVPPELSIVVV